MGWSNILHWGPLFTIVIIKSVVWSTIHCNSMWWPPYHSWPGFLNAAIFLFLSASTFYNFLYSLHVGPGYLPLNWKPTNEDDIQYLQFCTVCQGYKAPRSHHCRKCNRCIMKRDHHCIFINQCLGHLNHTNFLAFLISAVTGCAQACVIISCTMYRALHPTYYYYDQYSGLREVPFIILGLWPFVICLISLGLAAGVVFAVGFLFFVQMKVVLRNQTGIEDWVHEKAAYRREGTDEPPFKHPYNLGWRENFVQVINWSFQPKGDGITWKVQENVHPYAFTIEQIEQKKLKKERTVEYVVEKSYNGRWLPISFGLKVCLQPPCTDEARIPLRIGDKLAVSRWKKHWLYGEIQERNEVQMNPTERRALRGWFPRTCCSLSNYESEKDE